MLPLGQLHRPFDCPLLNWSTAKLDRVGRHSVVGDVQEDAGVELQGRCLAREIERFFLARIRSPFA